VLILNLESTLPNYSDTGAVRTVKQAGQLIALCSSTILLRGLPSCPYIGLWSFSGEEKADLTLLSLSATVL
jgi:hypothetical protein